MKYPLIFIEYNGTFILILNNISNIMSTSLIIENDDYEPIDFFNEAIPNDKKLIFDCSKRLFRI